jgi:protein phosphatase PTC1
MKDLVLSQPFTTETVMTLDDDLMIVACDGIWDTLSDQEAVNLIKDVQDPQEASDLLVKYALENGGVDNITCIVVRFVHKLDSPSPQPNDEADASFRTESTEAAAN